MEEVTVKKDTVGGASAMTTYGASTQQAGLEEGYRSIPLYIYII